MNNADCSPAWIGELNLIVSWPARELSPNYRGHWAEVARAKAKYREEGFYAAKEARLKEQMEKLRPDELLFMVADFISPDRRVRDDDNLMASLKSARDGIAAAIGVDDSRWRTRFGMVKGVSKPGRVILRFRCTPEPLRKYE